jgi:hypothetical protein
MATTNASDERRARWIIRVAGTAALVLTVTFLVILPAKPVHENIAGFVNPLLSFELASRPEHVFGVLGRPGEPERAEAVRRTDLGNRIDFLFMIAYPTLFAGIAFLLEAHGSLTRSTRHAMVALAIAMAFGDALENRELLFLSGASDPAAMAPSLARLQVFTRIKWYAIFVACVVLAAGAWREREWWRWSAPFFAGAAVCGVLSLVYLRAIEIGMYVLTVAWIMAYARAWRGTSDPA